MKHKFKVGDKVIFATIEGSQSLQWLGKTGTIIETPDTNYMGFYVLKEYPQQRWGGHWFKLYNKWEDICI